MLYREKLIAPMLINKKDLKINDPCLDFKKKKSNGSQSNQKEGNKKDKIRDQ